MLNLVLFLFNNDNDRVDLVVFMLVNSVLLFDVMFISSDSYLFYVSVFSMFVNKFIFIVLYNVNVNILLDDLIVFVNKFI